MRSVGAALVKLIATATSGLVSFTTNVIRPVKVTCEFSPIQEGTGDPSPDNVRPISGWTGCNITDVVNFLAGVTFERGTIAAATGQEQASTNRLRSDYIWLVAGTYTVTSKSGYKNVVDVYDSEKAFKKNESYTSWSETSSREFTLSSDRYIRILFSKPDNANITLNELTDNEMLIGSQSTTLSITFTDPSTGDSMTVYGGTVTLNEDGSADLVSDMWIYTIDGGVVRASNDSYNSDTSTYVRKNNFGIRYKKSISTVIDKNISDSLIYAKSNYGATAASNSWGNAYNSYTDIGIRLDNSLCGILATDTYAERVVKVNAYLADHPITVGGELETPITYHFDNIGQLNSFSGQNNIWHNMNGDITVEYWNKQ